MKILRNCSIFYGKLGKDLLDSQISWDFASEILDFSENVFSEKLEKSLKKVEAIELE